jgi:hypothetical protein
MNKAIGGAIKSGHGDAVLIAGFLGLILSDVIPTPGDALYFWDQHRLRKKMEAGEITPRQHAVKNALGYYAYNSLWWATVFGIVMCTKGDFKQKLKMMLGLAGSAAVFAVIFKNIRDDEKEYAGTASGTPVKIPDGVYHNAEILGYRVTVYKPDGVSSFYQFENKGFGLRNIQPAPCTVTVKKGRAIVKVNDVNT